MVNIGPGGTFRADVFFCVFRYADTYQYTVERRTSTKLMFIPSNPSVCLPQSCLSSLLNVSQKRAEKEGGSWARHKCDVSPNDVQRNCAIPSRRSSV